MEKYYVKTGIENIKLEEVKKLIEQTYWAKERSLEKIKVSMEHSICYGVFMEENDKLVGFARVITDYATTYYICDVIVDSDYRGIGIGKKLMEAINSNEEFVGLRGMLVTKDAHGLYRQYGFEEVPNIFMTKIR